MKELFSFFNNPVFIILGGIFIIFDLIPLFILVYILIKGNAQVVYRLGMGLSKRKIAIFATDEYEELKSLLVDSKIFLNKNISQINKKSVKKAEEFSLLLVHWNSFKDDIDEILRIKRDKAALIIYAPQEEGSIDSNIIQRINKERNSIIVNMRGRLLNDILVCMITTSYG